MVVAKYPIRTAHVTRTHNRLSIKVQIVPARARHVQATGHTELGVYHHWRNGVKKIATAKNAAVSGRRGNIVTTKR
jgi:hypothetical protein